MPNYINFKSNCLYGLKVVLYSLKYSDQDKEQRRVAQAAVVHLNLRAGSIFPVPVCTVSPGFWVNKADTQ